MIFALTNQVFALRIVLLSVLRPGLCDGRREYLVNLANSLEITPRLAEMLPGICIDEGLEMAVILDDDD